MPYETIVLDLDETIYPSSAGVMTAVKERINDYMRQVTGLSDDEVEALRQHYLHQYGTSLRGLQANYQVDVEDFMAYVHDVQADKLLQPDPELDAMLSRLPQRKIIFTNGSADHAENVLRALGIRHHFEQILDVRDFDLEPKPAEQAYDALLRHLPHAPEKAIYLDDRPENLPPAMRRGITAVLVAENGAVPPVGSQRIHTVLELERLLIEEK
jgi:putative hydrolase of the HAD superfamily